MFARKPVHYPGGRQDSNAEKELQALIALCLSDPGQNVVQIFEWGWLSGQSHFHYDMELCDANLRDYINSAWDDEQKKKMPFFADVNALGLLAKGLQVWNIMIDISAGIAFVHSKKYVHRDIKAENGTTTA